MFNVFVNKFKKKNFVSSCESHKINFHITSLSTHSRNSFPTLQQISISMNFLLQKQFFIILLQILLLCLKNSVCSQVQPEFNQNKPNGANTTMTKVCGATGLRLNLDIKKMYGKWYPVESYDMIHHLWPKTPIGHLLDQNKTNTNDSSCLILNLSEGNIVNETMKFMLSHRGQTSIFSGTRLGDNNHPGMSKWAVTWPNGEDTLTSFLAAGNAGINIKTYNWVLMVDCDINGLTTTGWTIFARKEGISDGTVETILSLVEGVDGLMTSNTDKLNPQECQE